MSSISKMNFLGPGFRKLSYDKNTGWRSISATSGLLLLLAWCAGAALLQSGRRPIDLTGAWWRKTRDGAKDDGDCSLDMKLSIRANSNWSLNLSINLASVTAVASLNTLSDSNSKAQRVRTYTLLLFPWFSQTTDRYDVKPISNKWVSLPRSETKLRQ